MTAAPGAAQTRRRCLRSGFLRDWPRCIHTGVARENDRLLRWQVKVKLLCPPPSPRERRLPFCSPQSPLLVSSVRRLVPRSGGRKGPVRTARLLWGYPGCFVNLHSWSARLRAPLPWLLGALGSVLPNPRLGVDCDSVPSCGHRKSLCFSNKGCEGA